MVNKVILVGNVGMDPEVRAMEGGAKVARLRLATTERYRDRQTNENKEHTEWHTITLWRGLADVVDSYVRKGSQLYIEGRLRTREWTDQQGNKRYTTEILADTMNLLGRRGDTQVSDNTGTYTARPAAQPMAQPMAQPQVQQAPAQPQYQQSYQQPYQQASAQPQYQQPQVAPQEDSDDLPF